MDASIIGLIAGGVFTTSLAYYWGLRSQKAAARLAAKNVVLAKIDEIVADVKKRETLVWLFTDSKESLKTLVFSFSSQLAISHRLKVNQAWDDYQALQIIQQQTLIPIPEPIQKYLPTFDLNEVEKERKAMLGALTNLRDMIADS